MKKLLKKTMCIVLCIVTAFTCLAFTSCKRDEGPDRDETKLQLNVQIYDGGFGVGYANSWKTRFESEHEDYVSPDGSTKGVQIWITPTKECSGTSLATSTQSWRDDVYIPINMSVYNTLAKDGAMLDLTDVITKDKLPGENVTIWEKLNSTYKGWHEVDGKVYGVPLYESSTGIAYDVDLFDDYYLYVNKNYENDSDPYKKFSSNLTDTNRAEGPDGIPNTGDDGLPKTYDEFFELCDYMAEIGIIPFLWAGKLQNYVSAFLQNLYADNAGLENLNAQYNFTGKTDYVTGFDSQGEPIVSSVDLNSDNGYEVFKQPGRYYALEFINRIISNKNYYNYNDCFGSVLDHLGAQEKYVYSAKSTQRIAFLIEGNYWYNEALGARQDFVEEYPDEADHRYGMLYFPKAREGMEGNMLVLDQALSCAFINANIDPNKIEIAKEFYKFIFTNQSLSDFTRITSTTSPYNYTMTKEELAQTSYLGQQMYDIHKSGGYFLPLNNNPMMLKNIAILKESAFFSTGGETVPTLAFKNYIYSDGVNGLTPQDYFNKNAKYYEDSWAQMKI